MNYKNIKGRLPIQSATYNIASAPYVPLLAKEGVKHKVGGKDGRGGLLVVDDDGDTTLQLLVVLRFDVDDDNPMRDQYDRAFVDAMKELREANLFTKDDIKKYDLLFHTCVEGCKQRFDFLCDWCPEGLKDCQYENRPLIHALIIHQPLESFAIFLKASIKHHKNDAGLLFSLTYDSMTACERAFHEKGENRVM